METKPTLIFALILLLGCGASPQFVAVPSDLNREDAPKQVIEMTAERWHFTPDVIHVKQGTLVTIRIKAIDGTHGFELGDFEINERIEENEVKEVEFYAGEKGEYGFRCSHFCGIGHFAMTGKVIIE
jgi:cytochrome c oxidase subunit 2